MFILVSQAWLEGLSKHRDIIIILNECSTRKLTVKRNCMNFHPPYFKSLAICIILDSLLWCWDAWNHTSFNLLFQLHGKDLSIWQICIQAHWHVVYSVTRLQGKMLKIPSIKTPLTQKWHSVQNPLNRNDKVIKTPQQKLQGDQNPLNRNDRVATIPSICENNSTLYSIYFVFLWSFVIIFHLLFVDSNYIE